MMCSPWSAGRWVWTLCSLVLAWCVAWTLGADLDLHCVNLATDVDGEMHARFLRSAKFAGVSVKSVLVAGNASPTETCDRDACPPDAPRSELDLLLAELEKSESSDKSDDSLVIVTRSVDNDVIIAATKQHMITRFAVIGADVVFASDRFCSQEEALCRQFPAVASMQRSGNRYLNAAVIVARKSSLVKLLTEHRQLYSDDYQVFFSKLYLDTNVREKYGLAVDHFCRLLQSMNRVQTIVDLRFRADQAYIQNTDYSTDPSVVFGDRSARIHVNALGNYLAGSWSPVEGCRHCWSYQVELGKDPTKFPTIMMAVYVETATPFFEEFVDQLTSIIYPKKKIHLLIHNNAKYHSKRLEAFSDRFSKAYASFTLISHEDKVDEVDARKRAVSDCLTHDTDFLFNIDSNVQIDNPYVLKLLIEQNVDILSPLLVKPYSSVANFWGSMTEDGSYAESGDFQEIVENRARGLWNVPVITSCHLIKKSVLLDPASRPDFVSEGLDPQLAFAFQMRASGRVMYVTNRASMGHLVATDEFETGRLFDELWQLEHNRWDWERRYLHANYSTALQADTVNEQPCTDVYWFPLVTERFCQQLIDTMEDYGRWSSGTSDDPRLEGGYESVPTRDIHMKQIDYEEVWMSVLRDYVRPLQEKVFPGYHSDPLTALLNFVVRYRPDEQPALRPHHDTSTYTINIALNTPGRDYQGGGCRFLRYNCSVTDSRRGWLLMHPGRLSHYHEGLPTTSGTRYIMISFVDP